MIELQNEDPITDITLIIDSYGGDLFSAFSIVDIMDMLTCDIKTICIGKAMSAGQLIFSSGTPNKRFMSKNARLMLHNPSSRMEGSVPDVEIEIKELRRCRNSFVKRISKSSNLSKKEIFNLIDRNVYLNAKQSIKLGLADGLLKRLK